MKSQRAFTSASKKALCKRVDSLFALLERALEQLGGVRKFCIETRPHIEWQTDHASGVIVLPPAEEAAVSRNANTDKLQMENIAALVQLAHAREKRALESLTKVMAVRDSLAADNHVLRQALAAAGVQIVGASQNVVDLTD